MSVVAKKNDAFGMEMLNHYKGEDVIEIIERSDGYIDGATNGLNVYFADFKNWCVSEKKAISLIKGKTLDLGCGAGRVSLYLQSKGIDSLGIDNSALAVKVCKLRGVKRAKVLAIEMLSELKEKNFQAVTMLGNNFGLLGTPQKGKKILKQLHKMTTDDAIIVAQTLNISLTKDPWHLSYQKELQKKGKLPGELKLRCRYKNIIGPWFDYLMVTSKQMDAILKGTGWKISKIIKEKSGPLYCAVIVKD